MGSGRFWGFTVIPEGFRHSSFRVSPHRRSLHQFQIPTQLRLPREFTMGTRTELVVVDCKRSEKPSTWVWWPIPGSVRYKTPLMVVAFFNPKQTATLEGESMRREVPNQTGKAAQEGSVENRQSEQTSQTQTNQPNRQTTKQANKTQPNKK